MNKLYFFSFNTNNGRIGTEVVSVVKETPKTIVLEHEPENSRCCSKIFHKNNLESLDASWGWKYFMASETSDKEEFVRKCIDYLKVQRTSFSRKAEECAALIGELCKEL